MWKTSEGSTGRLIQLCFFYFLFYVITGVTVKYFLGSPEHGLPGMKDMEFLVYSTVGGTSICLFVVLARGWYRLESNRILAWGGLRFPAECLYIVPSGVCTAVIIPTTTLMYMLPISVMVAMIIMRASVIIISRVVDAVQIRQGILHKKVYREEDLAAVFALMAAGTNILWVGKGDFEFAKNPVAMTILASYIAAYSIRIYLMNYFKNTRAAGVKLDNKGFFAIEQITAASAMALACAFLFYGPHFGLDGPAIGLFRGAILEPRPLWGWAVLAGTAYGFVAFFSVFIFMFKGRTATFAGLVNRLTSLVAGTTATLLSWLFIHGKFPKNSEWVSLIFILTSVAFLAIAERRRSAELVAAHEIEAKPL